MSPPHRLLVLVLLLTSALAGCASPEDADADADPVHTPPGSAWHVSDTVDLGLPCDRFCEPTITVDADGWVYVSGAGRLLRSQDAVAYDDFDLPPMPPIAGPTGFRTDTIVQAGPDGSLYYNALVASFDFVTSSLILHGVQVARSDDHGGSWASSTLVSPVGGQAAFAYGADRQWLAFDPNGPVYLAFQRIPAVYSFTLPRLVTPLPGIWVARSDDRAVTFGDLVEATPGARATSSYILGPPVVRDGVLEVPHHWYPGDERPAFAAISRSADQGATFETQEVGPAGAFFPQLIHDGQRAWYVTWSTPGDLVIASSADDGASWAPYETWSESGRMASSPWTAMLDGTLAVLWMEFDGDSEDRYVLHWTTLDYAGQREDAVVASFQGGAGLRANTDFAQFALRDGVPLVVLGDNDGSTIRVLALGR